MTRRSGGVSVFIAAAMVVLTGCSPAPVASPAGGANLTRGNVTVRLELPWMNQLNHFEVGSNNSTFQMTMAMYDRMVGISPDGKKVVPYVATDWTVSISSITFKIRTGITCSDGTPLTPTAIANSYQHLITPGPTNNNWARLIGSPPYTVSGDDAAGTVTFTEAPNNELLNNFSWPHISIICPAGFEPGADFTKKSYGSGPFALDSTTADSVMVKRRPEWTWGPNDTKATDPGVPDTITFRVVENATTAANLLVTGVLDVAAIRGPEILRLRQEKDLTENTAFSMILGHITMNHLPEHPGADKQVRLAMITAIDVESYNKAAYNGEGQVGTSILSVNHPCYDPDAAKSLPANRGNIDKAREILLADGYTAGADGKLQKDGKPLRIEVVANPLAATGPEYSVEQFNKMGATSVIIPSTPAVIAGQYDVAWNPGPVRLPITDDGPNYFSGTFPPAGSNASRTQDPVLDDLLAKARADPTCNSWFRWQEYLLSEYHTAPFASSKFSTFARGMAPITILGNYFDITSLRRAR